MDELQSEVSHVLGTVLTIFEVIAFVFVYIAAITLSGKYIAGRIAIKLFGRNAGPAAIIFGCILGVFMWIVELAQEFPVDLSFDFHAHLRVATRMVVETNLIFALLAVTIWLIRFIFSGRETGQENANANADEESKQALPV